MIDLELSEIQVEEISDNHHILTISPLPTGYGTTVGNALRRVMLSSIEGASITEVKMNGVTHEFSTSPGVKDSVIDIVLNLRQVRFIYDGGEPITGKLSVNKAGDVKAKDLKLPGDAKVVDGNVVITTLEKKTKFDLEVTIEKGVGFSAVINRDTKKNTDPTLIAVDALFSPIIKVNYKISSARVGQATDLDKLDMEVITDGTITPKDALSKGAGILRNYFGLLDPEYLTADQKKTIKTEEEEVEEEEETILGNKSGRKYTPVEVLKLSPRTLNALINNKINSVESLITYTDSKLSNLKGFGAKAMFEVKEALKVINQTLSEDN